MDARSCRSRRIRLDDGWRVAIRRMNRPSPSTFPTCGRTSPDGGTTRALRPLHRRCELGDLPPQARRGDRLRRLLPTTDASEIKTTPP